MVQMQHENTNNRIGHTFVLHNDSNNKDIYQFGVQRRQKLVETYYQGLYSCASSINSDKKK